MTVSEVDVANSALDHLGEQAIVSLDDARKSARLIKRNLPLLRDKLLRRYPWKFATKRLELAPETTTPAFGFQNAFPLPTDCLHVIGMYDASYPLTYYTSDSYPFVVEKNKILSNQNPFNLFYTEKVTDPAQFDPIFVELLAIEIAMKIAFGLTSGTQHTRTLKALRDELMDDARIADSFEGIPADRETEDWIGRREGFYNRGPRNHTVG